MESLTLSQWVVQCLDKPSIIKHPSHEMVFICDYYRLITETDYEMQVVGLFHLNYLKRQSLLQPTCSGIHKAMLGGVSRSILRKTLSSLVANGWLTSHLLPGEEIKQALCNKLPQKFPNGLLNCNWCKGETVALQEHHYPIAKSDGGTAVVAICANCHFEFHQLLSTPRYQPSEKLISFFETTVFELTRGDNR